MFRFNCIAQKRCAKIARRKDVVYANERGAVDIKFVILLMVFLFVAAAIASLLQWAYVNQRQGIAIKQQLRKIQEQIRITEKQLKEAEMVSPEEIERREKETEVLTAQRVSEDVAVEGIEIIVEGETKTIINYAQGYRMSVPLRLVVARSVSSSWIELHDKEFMCLEDPSCEPVMRIVAEDNNQKALPIEQWFDVEEKKAGGPLYSPREEVFFEGRSAYRVIEEIPRVFEGVYYYWGKGTKIYYLRVSFVDEELYRASIETFRLE